MKIDLLWTAVIAELKFIKLLMKTETVEMTEIVKVTMMILIPEKLLFKIIIILNLVDTALTAAIIQN